MTGMILLIYRKHFAFWLTWGVLFALGCGDGSPKQPTPSPSAASPSSPGAVGSESQSKQVLMELKALDGDVGTAVAAEDWSRTRQLLQQGLEIIAANPGKYEIHEARFLLARAKMARERSRETEARRYFADAMAIFHVHKNATGRFETHLGLGKLEARRGDYAAAEREYGAARELLGEVNDKLLHGIFKLETGRLASKRVERQKAKTDFLEAIAIFESERDQKHLAETLMYLANEEDALGNTDQCRRRLGRALALFRELSNIEGEARALHRLARVAEREKKYNHAKKLLKKVYVLYDKLDRKADKLRVERHINALPEQD